MSTRSQLSGDAEWEVPQAQPEATIPNTSVVVPVFNSALSLPDLVARIFALADDAGPAELILVDDGSTDSSWPCILGLHSEFPRIYPIRLSRNFGQHNALLAGIRAANAPYIATIDDDLQNPPEEIDRLLRQLDLGSDVVYGAPEQEHHGVLRNLASRITKLTLTRVMGARSARSVSAFRVFRTDLRRAFEQFKGPFVSIDVLLTWSTSRFGAIQVKHEPRRRGSSQYTVRKLFTHAMNMLTGFTTWPLRLASATGFAFSAFGVAVLLYVLVRYAVAGHSIPGFPFLASIIAIFSGAQLFALGIIGEYLARVHFRLMEQPCYSIMADIPVRQPTQLPVTAGAPPPSRDD